MMAMTTSSSIRVKALDFRPDPTVKRSWVMG